MKTEGNRLLQVVVSTRKSLFSNYSRRISFSDVKLITYHKDPKRGIGGASIIYLLAFYLEDFKECQIYVGLEKDCKKLGVIVSRFMKKPLFYGKDRFKEQLPT